MSVTIINAPNTSQRPYFKLPLSAIVLTPAEVAVVLVPTGGNWRGLSAIIDQPASVQVDVCGDDYTVIQGTDSSYNHGNWANNINSGALPFLSITTPVTAVRLTNNGAGNANVTLRG